MSRGIQQGSDWLIRALPVDSCATYNLELIGGIDPQAFNMLQDDYVDIGHVNKKATDKIFEISRSSKPVMD